MPSGSSVQPALWQPPRRIHQHRRTLRLYLPISATAACRTIEHPARWASSSTSVTSSTGRTLCANSIPGAPWPPSAVQRPKTIPRLERRTLRHRAAFLPTSQGTHRNVELGRDRKLQASPNLCAVPFHNHGKRLARESGRAGYGARYASGLKDSVLL